MKYGYARVSTKMQDLTSQIDILNKEGCAEIIEEKFTGTTTDRPQLSKLLDKLCENDTLVVTKLDRLARNTKEGIEIVETLFGRGVKVHVLNVGLLEDTTMGHFFLQTLLAVAEMERNLIIERTQEGKAIAKQRPDFKEGRPKKFNEQRLKEALELREKMSYSMKKTAEITGISLSTLERYARKQREASK
ncbi:recombinase family protein [Bacillus cereus]|nr:recombinase family protein [Bacillus cereus]MRD19744.1 helix-turn-helix domain-containing protein [Bacillus thuringiensis]MDA2126981.1 recombinase family protein [Bacillus cereus]MDA2149690.1 recombinase family protein [Bacillus cereus]MDA2534056.1 recombinase family protein [Bacillus cereus]